jgi:hypothetical protein
VQTLPLTVGAFARRYGVPAWRVRRALDEHFPDAARVNLWRLISPEQEAALVAELRRLGYACRGVAHE